MMDQAKLERLRALFGDASGGAIHTPRFREVAASQFRGKVRQKPYSGIPTLLDAPHREGPDGLDVALVGVPMDLGVTNRPGARFGPRAVRTIERIGPYHHVLDVVPFAVLKVADLGDVPFRSRFSLEESIKDIETFYKQIVAAGVRPLSVGGDHSVTYPILKAVGEARPVGMVHIDAHFDTAGEYENTKFQHGAPFRHAVLDGVLDPERSIQIGIRGSAEYLGEFSYESGMTVIHAEEFARMGVDAVIEKARSVVGEQPFYITIDVDGFDPTFAPGTGTPEVGGLLPLEVQTLLRGLKGLDVVGGDVVEIAPQYDANTTTAHVGAQMLFEIISLMALAPRPGGK
ncbi:MAG: agmatinase [Betaproteobacteria bacterium]|nr:agmatinase [Betaproteobacteria bacterium]